MLPRSPHVEAAFTDPRTGFLSISQPLQPKLFIECSSIDTASSTALASRVEKSGIGSFIDAPVSGGPHCSEAGTLTFMVGGPKDHFQRALPVLSMMGTPESIFYCSEAGAGLATKQLNNYVAYVSYLGLCEVMSAGLNHSLDPNILSDVINRSSGMCWNSLHHNPVKGVNPEASSVRDFRGGFTTELAAGVILNAVTLMDQVDTKTVLAPIVREVFNRALVSRRCKQMEARSFWKMFVEDDGVDLKDFGI